MTTTRPMFCILAAAAMLAVDCGGTAPQVATTAPTAESHPLSDEEITAAVAHKLRADEGPAGEDIQVATTNGIVELGGTVPHLLAAQRAPLLAESIRGVRSVSNRIVVEPVDRDDAAIEADVVHALLLDLTTESVEIDVSVDDQVATLKGTVDSWPELRAAGRVAASVKGLREVDNRLQVRRDLPRSDREIENDVRSRLDWDTLVDADVLAVHVRRGDVVLSGSVGSAAEKRRARALAWVSGARRVIDDDLEVLWWLDAPGERTAAMLTRDDAEIASAIRAAFLLDPRLDSDALTPIVEASSVTLRGRVPNLRAREAAAEIARHTTGVVSVTNDLVVDPGRRLDDDDVREALRWALSTNPVTEGFDIEIEVADGWATLTGNVENNRQRAEAEDIALGMLGVRGVTNRLAVAAPNEAFVRDPYLGPFYPYILTQTRFVPAKPTAKDQEIQAAIEYELQWSAAVDASRVDVRVVNGVATLHGAVDARFEREAAIDGAYKGGAVEVIDRLTIDEPS